MKCCENKKSSMWAFLSACLIVAVVIMVGYAYEFSIYNTSPVYSTLDDEPYLVHNAHDDKQDAADRMAYIHESIIKLLRHLKNKYTDPNNVHYRKVKFLLDNFNPDVFIENSPYNIRNFTAYTEDKGGSFVICLRKKDTPNAEFVDMNTVLFVVIHETAHLFTEQFGHDKIFWENFKFLLGEAIEVGIYEPVNYTFNPTVYCGLRLDYNPYYDQSL